MTAVGDEEGWGAIKMMDELRRIREMERHFASSPYLKRSAPPYPYSGGSGARNGSGLSITRPGL